jgi:hypothetical protein
MASPDEAPLLPLSPPSPPFGRQFRLALVLVAVVTLAVFGRASGFGFLLWDDDIQLTSNPTLHALDWTMAWRMFTRGYAIRYQPLSWLSSALLVRVGGMNAFLFHSYNILLHALSAVLLAALLRRLVIRALPAQASDVAAVVLAPVFGSLVFALHPLRVEPVAWATGWRYCQSVVLMLASALLYLRAMDARPIGALRTAGYWFSVVAFALSAFTYPFCLEWPLALVVLDVYPLRRWRSRGAWLEKLPFAFIAVLALVASVAVRLTTDVANYAPASLADYGVGARLMKAMQVWADATWRGLFPVDLRPVYIGSTPFDAMSARSIFSAVVLAAVTILLVRLRRAHPVLLALWLVHLALLGAKLGLLEVGHVEAADRFSYPAGVAWAGLATCGFLAAGRLGLGRKVRVVLAAALVVLLGLMSFRHLSLWRNDVTFFQAGLASVGNTGLRDDMLWRLALAHWRQGDLGRALPLLEEAVARRPGDLRLRLMRAGLFKGLGREPDMRREMGEAMRLTGASTPEEAIHKISQFVQLPSP